jgi:hypothetical protein
VDELLERVSRRVQDKYYGKYRGHVRHNDDPEHRGRLRLRVPSVLGEAVTGWALPCLPFGGLPDQGLFTVPEVGARVWVEFEEGELSYPLWTGTYWEGPDEAPAELPEGEPTQRVLKTPAGHTLIFEDSAGEEIVRLVHAGGAQLELVEDGSVRLTDSSGAALRLEVTSGQVRLEDSQDNQLHMDSTGIILEDRHENRVRMAADGVEIDSPRVVLNASHVALGGDGGEPLIKGLSFLSLFATHVHTTTVPGSPTSPPIPQGEQTTLSTTTFTT